MERREREEHKEEEDGGQICSMTLSFLGPSGLSSDAASMKLGCQCMAQPVFRKGCCQGEKQKPRKVQGQPPSGPVSTGRKGWALMAA